MACDLWTVPLSDVFFEHADNPFAADLAEWNAALAGAGLPRVPLYRHLPEHHGGVEHTATLDYQALHHLRRVRLLQLAGVPPTPVDSLGADYQELLDGLEHLARGSHLVWHHDHSGGYVPLEFPQPVESERLLEEGGPLGSSPALLRELDEVAPLIGVDPAVPPPPPRPSGTTAFDQPAEEDPLNHGPFHRERAAWAALRKAAARSVEDGALIVLA